MNYLTLTGGDCGVARREKHRPTGRAGIGLQARLQANRDGEYGVMAGLGFATSKAWANARRRPFGSRCCALFYAPNTPLPQLFYRPADSRVVNAQMGGNILHAEMARRIGINHTLPDIVTVKILAQWFGQCTELGAWDFRVV